MAWPGPPPLLVAAASARCGVGRFGNLLSTAPRVLQCSARCRTSHASPAVQRPLTSPPLPAAPVTRRDKQRGFQLYQSDPSGNYGGWKATAIGANHQAATNVLQVRRQAADAGTAGPRCADVLALPCSPHSLSLLCCLVASLLTRRSAASMLHVACLLACSPGLHVDSAVVPALSLVLPLQGDYKDDLSLEEVRLVARLSLRSGLAAGAARSCHVTQRCCH